jgi:hypothetical protein
MYRDGHFLLGEKLEKLENETNKSITIILESIQ